MRKLGAGVIAVLCLVAIAGCTTNKSIANVTTSTQAKLQLAVGTINDNFDTLGIGGVTLNVVTTFRNQFGNSAYRNPGQYTLTGPGGTIVAASPGNPCNQLFSYGDFPGCEGDGLGDALWGVAPTYTPPNPNGGYALGFIQTGAAVATGTYTVSTVVPVNGQNVHYSASTNLNTIVTLPNATGVTSFASDGAGGGTFTIGNPLKPFSKVHRHGVISPTEYLIFVVNGSLGTVATVETSAASPTTATIVGSGDCSSSVGGFPIPCGSNSAYVIEADYPLVEDGPPANHAQAPTLDGANGSADISVSAPATINE